MTSKYTIKKQLLTALTVVLAVFGTQAGAAPDKAAEGEESIFYPPAPNLPRVQYLTTYATANDVSTSTGGFRDFVFGGADKEQQAIQKPYGLAVHDGAIFAVDTRGYGYVVFDVANGKWRLVTAQGDGAMLKPINITIDDDGTRYITDTQREVVIVFDKNDRFVRTLGEPDQFRPVDAAISGNRIYVTDARNQKVHVMDKTTGETLFVFGEAGTGEGQFAHPTGIAIGLEGTVWVSDTSNFRIQQFTADGKYMREIGQVGTGFGQFARPKGLDVDREGRIYVADAAFQNVQIFDDEANVLMFFGGAHGRRDTFSLPTVVKIDYENVEHFRQFVDPDFEIEYLVLVANQFGPNKVAVYGFGSLKE